MPALVIPTIIGRHDGSGRPGLFDSVIQAAWSFMVALRSRGLGSVWTTMYLGQADAVAELLELPDDVTQICLFPVAYTKGVDFSASPRRHPAREIAYFDRFGQTRPSADDPTLVEVVADTQPNQAVVDFVVEFEGQTAHAAYDPWNGRSAADGAEVFTFAINLLREHVRP